MNGEVELMHASHGQRRILVRYALAVRPSETQGVCRSASGGIHLTRLKARKPEAP